MNQWPTSNEPYAPYHAKLAEKPKKPRRWPWVVGIVAAFVIGIGVGGVQPATPPLEGVPQASTQAAPADASQPAYSPQDQPSQAVTEAQEAVEDSTFSNGVYEVGVDMEPGRYKTDGPGASSFAGMCYWERASNDSGQLQSVIANDNIQGPGSVTVKDGEFVKFSNGCTWTKQ